jgi:predicted nucleic acid-binding protein
MKYLWDTNIAIYYLQQQLPQNAEKYIDSLINENQPILSVVTEIELLSWKSSSETDTIVIQNFVNDTLVIELDRAIKLKTVEIRKSIGVKLPDAIIAATAITFELTLLTRNVSDFQRVAGLKCVNPFDVVF